MSNVKFNIQLLLTNGAQPISDDTIVSPEYVNPMRKHLEQFHGLGTMNFFTMTIQDKVIAYNPAHIISLRIHEANTTDAPTITEAELKDARLYPDPS